MRHIPNISRLSARSLSALSLLALAGCAGGGAVGGPGVMFDDMDGNGDARVNNGEFTGYFFQAAFAEFDADNDATITPAEWRARETDGDAEARFAELDTDGSGRVIYEEFTHPAMKRSMVRNIFRTLDANGDGVLEKSELSIE